MDVMFVISSKTIGGAEIYVFRVLEHLYRKFDFSIVAPHEMKYNDSFMTFVNRFEIAVFFYRRPFAFEPLSMYQFRHIITDNKPKLLHVNMNWIGNCAPELLVASEVKQNFIMTQHIVPVNIKIDFIRRWIISRNIRQAKEVICVSKYTRDNIQNFLREPQHHLTVIHNGIDISGYKGRVMSVRSKIKFLTVARLTKQKGLEYLLRAIPAVIRNMQDVEFTIVGEGELRGELETLAKKLGISHIVTFVGFSNNIPVVLRESDAFVLPSIEEGLPLTILEAMATGVPVLATEVGGNKEIITNNVNGVLVPPRNVSALSDQIIRLATDREFRLRIGRVAQKEVTEKFTIGKMIARVEELYDRFLG